MLNRRDFVIALGATGLLAACQSGPPQPSTVVRQLRRQARHEPRPRRRRPTGDGADPAAEEHRRVQLRRLFRPAGGRRPRRWRGPARHRPDLGRPRRRRASKTITVEPEATHLGLVALLRDPTGKIWRTTKSGLAGIAADGECNAWAAAASPPSRPASGVDNAGVRRHERGKPGALVGGALPPARSTSSSRTASSRRWCAARCRPARLQTCGFRSLTLDPSLLEAGPGRRAVGARHLPRRHALRHPRDHGPARADRRRPRDRRPARCCSRCRSRPPGGASFDPAHARPSGARYRGPIARVRDAVHGGARRRGDRDRPAAGAAARAGQVGRRLHRAAGRRDRAACAPTAASRSTSTFLPPTLATGAVAFYAQLLQEVITGLDRIAEAHGRMVLGGAGRSVENLLVLELANAARPRLAHMLAQDVFHPAELFLELAGLAGRMATYGSSSRRLSELPAYDHLAPAPAFAALTDTLRSLILSLRYVEPKSRALPVMRHATNVWKVRIDNPEMLDGQPHRGARRLGAFRRRAAQDLRQPGDGRLGRASSTRCGSRGCPASR